MEFGTASRTVELKLLPRPPEAQSAGASSSTAARGYGYQGAKRTCALPIAVSAAKYPGKAGSPDPRASCGMMSTATVAL
jgi:hypothetical protein